SLLAAIGLIFAAGNVQAQDPSSQGSFDPKRMHQMLMDRLRQQMEIKDDAEWKAISNRVHAVVEARRSLGLGGPMGPPGGGPPPGGRSGGPGGQVGQGPGGFPQPGESGGGPSGPGGPEGGGGPGGPGGFNQANPELDALR